jgi:hypothetical protein
MKVRKYVISCSSEGLFSLMHAAAHLCIPLAHSFPINQKVRWHSSRIAWITTRLLIHFRNLPWLCICTVCHFSNVRFSTRMAGIASHSNVCYHSQYGKVLKWEKKGRWFSFHVVILCKSEPKGKGQPGQRTAHVIMNDLVSLIVASWIVSKLLLASFVFWTDRLPGLQTDLYIYPCMCRHRSSCRQLQYY